MRERGGAYTVSVRHWLVFRCAPRTDVGWGPYNSTPTPAATTTGGASRLAPRRGGAFPGSAARKRNWTDRRVLRAEAVRQWLSGEGRRRRPQAGSNTRSHQLQRTNKRRRCLINVTLTIALRVHAARSPAKCHFSQSLPDLLIWHSLLRLVDDLEDVKLRPAEELAACSYA